MSNKFVYLRDPRVVTALVSAAKTDDERRACFRGAPMIGCVAFNVSGDKLSYQLSVVNPGKKGSPSPVAGDKFDRSRGRGIAEGRLAKSPIEIEMDGLDNLNHFETQVVLMSSLAVSKTAPTRAVLAAKAWLNNSQLV
jgi:hypothetical protein